MANDITLQVRADTKVLQSDIEKAINNVKAKAKIDVDAQYLKKSVSDVKFNKIELEVNKGKFLSAVNEAIRSVSNNAKQQVKIQIKVDENYLRAQVQGALKDLGKFVNGSGADATVQTRMFSMSTKSDAADYNKLLKTLEKVGKLQADVSGSKDSRAGGVAANLNSEAAAINQLAEAARSGKIALSEFNDQRAQIDSRVANYSGDVESIKAAEKQAKADAQAAKREANEAAREAQRQAAAEAKAQSSGFNDTIKQLNLVKQGYSEVIKTQSLLESSASAKGSPAYERLVTLQKELQNTTDSLDKGNISYDEAKVKIAAASAEVKRLEQEMREADQVNNTLGDKFQRFKQHLTTITSVVRAFQMLRMVIQPVVNAVTEVDTALTQLRIVTQENDTAITSYANNIMKVADQTAGSVKDLINSTTTFARLGYTLEQSTDLAKYTQMLENVGNIDESSATAAITAIVKAYGVQTDELESVMDKLVDVGNHFPISVAEIAEGMNNAGSMLSVATGGNLDQSIAMLTAANTTIQNISKSSTGLRTIAARIRNVGTELNELGESMTDVEYDAIVQALTKNNVALTDSNGQLRNTYDILLDLSQVWETLSENEQAALAKTLSGTRQQNKSFISEQLFTFTAMCSKRNPSNCWDALKLFVPQRMSEQLTA